jgi:membrane protease YdiL (CAAX protease family)
MLMKNRSPANALHSYRNRIASALSGAYRLRPGKAIRSFYAIFCLLMATIGCIAHFCHYPFRIHGVMTPGNEILLRTAFGGAAMIATIVMSRLDKESWLAYGLGSGHRTAHFGFGLLTGVLSLSALMAALVATGGASVTHTGMPASSLTASGVLWAIVFVLVGWSEELVFRGYVFFRLARDVGPVAAAIRTSLVFGVAHAFNQGESVLGLLQVVLFGLVACFVVWRTGSLWWAAGMHAAWDWSASFLFGAADSGRIINGHWLTSQAIGPSWLSGGATGPEGSLFAIPAVAILGLIVMLAFPKGSGAMRFGTKGTT